MNSRKRIISILDHKEADRVPYDLAGSHVTGIHVKAYINLCKYLDISPEPIIFSDIYQQIVVPCDELLEKLEVDTRGLFPLCSHNCNIEGEDVGSYLEHTDEWDFVQYFPKEGGHYWSLAKSPIDGMMADKEKLKNYQWPKGNAFRRVAGLRKLAEKYHRQEKMVMVKSICAGLFEMGQRIRGMENFLCDLLADKKTACFIMDKVLEVKKSYWKMLIDELGGLIDIVVETDDYGTQESQLVSEDIFHEMIEPRLADLVSYVNKLFATSKPAGKKSYFFLHSCGNVRPLLPSFIEMGVDIINPVHLNAKGMEPEGLKADFGGKVTFWGGGVETQNLLPNGTPDQVRKDVKRNVNILKQDGGFVFNTVHNIQGEVPPKNIMAMWEALQEYGQY